MRPFLGAVLLCLLAACGDQIQLAEPPGRGQGGATNEESGRIDPHGNAGGNPHAAAEDPFADESSSGPAVDTSKRVDPSKVFFAGTIDVDPSIKLPPSYAVFIMASKPRGKDPKTGQPRRSQPVFVQVYRGSPKFPFRFELTGKNMFGGDTTVEEPLEFGYILSERGTVDPSSGGLFLRNVLGDQVHEPGSMDVRLTITR